MVMLEDKSLLDIAAREEYEDPVPQKRLEGRTVYLSRSNYGPLKRVAGLVEISDFGLAVPGDRPNSGPIQAEIYRAPEVILGLGWSYKADIWSIGCILIELYYGKALFQTHENREHLAMMEKVLEQKLPLVMTLNSERSVQEKYFNRGYLRWPEIASSSQSVDFVAHLKTLKQMCGPHHLFYDLLRRLLEYEPDIRWSAKEALEHEFFR